MIATFGPKTAVEAFHLDVGLPHDCPTRSPLCNTAESCKCNTELIMPVAALGCMISGKGSCTSRLTRGNVKCDGMQEAGRNGQSAAKCLTSHRRNCSPLPFRTFAQIPPVVRLLRLLLRWRSSAQHVRVNQLVPHFSFQFMFEIVNGLNLLTLLRISQFPLAERWLPSAGRPATRRLTDF